MVRLTADLVWKSPHFFNAVRERELDLRGIPLCPFPTVEAVIFLSFFLSFFFFPSFIEMAYRNAPTYIGGRNKRIPAFGSYLIISPLVVR
jgi:hypothetical protein